MKERPILMQADPVKAILDGRKTMTRRVIVHQPKWMGELNNWHWKHSKNCVVSPHGHCWPDGGKPLWMHKCCPYGQVGDRLWVRETWKIKSFLDGEPMQFEFKDGAFIDEGEVSLSAESRYEEWYERICIQSTDELGELWNSGYRDGGLSRGEDDVYYWDKSPLKWRPSIHMPRWASRINLEITGERVERLQEITFDDAFAEGMEHSIIMHNPVEDLFLPLWDPINAKRGYGWGANPWVWVVCFKVIK